MPSLSRPQGAPTKPVLLLLGARVKLRRLSGAACTAILLLVFGAAQAAPKDALQRYYNSVHTLTGEFTQTTRDENGNVVESASGSFAIARPDRFNWHYRTPYEQRIVADGEWLWVYDPGLSQVTVRPLDQVLGVGPALLLSGDYEDLAANFDIHAGQGGTLVLTPVEDRWQFQQVRLRLRDGVPVSVEVDNGMGLVTRLELSDLESNVEIPDSRFRFDVPEGADLVAPPGFER